MFFLHSFHIFGDLQIDHLRKHWGGEDLKLCEESSAKEPILSHPTWFPAGRDRDDRDRDPFRIVSWFMTHLFTGCKQPTYIWVRLSIY